jgi:uncharacterized protein (TIGR02246 family)
MKIRNPFPRAVLPAATALVFLVFTQPQALCQDKAAGPQPADKPEQADKPDDAIETLGLAARRFVAAFNGRDAAAIAGLFMPNGEIRGHDGTIISGREEIETFYHGIFAADSVPGIALEASSVHFISPDIAIEDGVVHFTYAEDEPVRSISYSATQLRQADGSWLTAVSCDKLEVTPPSEQIKPLRWLIGEWTLEGENGLRVDMAIHPDERENYLLGEALITTAEGDAQSTSLRIGWNPATSSIHWWNFDSDGGHTSGQWTRQDDHWLIQNSGVTAANETTSSSQSLARDGADSMVWVATNRTVAGETLPDISFRFVRRAPAPGSSLTNDGNGS